MPRAQVCAGGCGKITVARRCPECQARADAKQREYDDSRAHSYYHSQHWQRVSRACKQRDSGRCVICGSTDRVIAHHIESRDNFINTPTDLDRLGNLVTLCSPHHSELEADRRNGRDDTDLIRLTRVLAY